MFSKRQQCSVCSHGERTAIDAELASGAATREIARRFGLSKSAVARHILLHVVDADDGSGDAGVKQLLNSAQRALRRAEARGNHRDVMEALRVLGELRRRHRISSASTAQAEPHSKKDLVSELRRIYGLSPIAVRVIEDPPKTGDRKLVQNLRQLVERVADSQPKVAAAATFLASLLLHEPLDEETKGELKKLLRLEGDENDGTAVMDEEVNTAGADADEPSEARHDEP